MSKSLLILMVLSLTACGKSGGPANSAERSVGGAQAWTSSINHVQLFGQFSIDRYNSFELVTGQSGDDEFVRFEGDSYQTKCEYHAYPFQSYIELGETSARTEFLSFQSGSYSFDPETGLYTVPGIEQFYLTTVNQVLATARPPSVTDMLAGPRPQYMAVFKDTGCMMLATVGTWFL